MPVPVPGTCPLILPFALEAGMPMVNVVPLMTPSTVIVSPLTAARLPPLLPRAMPRLLEPELSIVKFAFPKIVPPLFRSHPYPSRPGRNPR